MKYNDFLEGINLIEINYNKILTKDKIGLFYECLKDLDKDTYMSNIQKHIKSNIYMPNIAQIRGEQKNRQNQYINYEQRNYSDVDFDKLYTNSQDEEEER